MKNLLFTIAMLSISICYATEKTVVANAGNGWSNANNWSPVGVPQNNDVVNVPEGKTITVKGNIYSNTPSIIIKVSGILDFDPSGKLELSNSSYIQLYTNAKITSNGSSSEQIKIGGQMKYNGQNDGTITGPKFASIASPNSIPGSPGAGFEDGALPIKLVSFGYRLNNNSVELHFTITSETSSDIYTLERKDTNDWKALSVFMAASNSHTAEYNFADAGLKNSAYQYRLRLTDALGHHKYSKILKVEISKPVHHLNVYPNPTDGAAKIEWNIELAPDKIMLYDMQGKRIMSDNLESNRTHYNLNLKSLDQGNYVVMLFKANDCIQFVRLVKK